MADIIRTCTRRACTHVYINTDTHTHTHQIGPTRTHDHVHARTHTHAQLCYKRWQCLTYAH